MPSSEERQTRSLMDIAGEARKVRMILEAMLENNTILTRAVKTDIEAHAFKPIDPRGLKPRFDLDMLVVVYDESHVRDGWRGKIVDLSSLSATVLLEDGVKLHLNGNQMLPLDEKPAHVCGGPEYCVVCREGQNPPEPDEKYIPVDGFLYPHEWRVNLGMPPIHKSTPNSHEDEPMTEEAFRIYNAGLSESMPEAGEHAKGDF